MSIELTNALLHKELPLHRPRIGRFALHVSERKLLLMLFDVLLLNLMFCLSRAGADAPAMLALLAHHPLWFAVLSLVWMTIAWAFGCYRLDNAAQPLPALTGVFCTIAAAWAIYLCIPLVTPMLPGSRLEFLRFPLLACSAIGLWRLIYATVLVQPDFRLRALIVGAGESGTTLARLMAQTQRGNHTLAHTVGYQVLGFVDDDPFKQNQSIEGAPILGSSHDLAHIAEKLHPHEIVIAITHGESISGELFEAIQLCREMGIALTTMPALYERLTGRVAIEHSGRTFHVAVPLTPRPFYQLYVMTQRFCDIIAGLVGCLLLLLVMPFVWLANCWKSPGPLFYTQERIGKGGRRFNIFKFRSMRVDAEAAVGAVWAEENDPRITGIGRFLRKTRLDEVPQFWNVLRGDMSLVGPRPERPHFVAQLAQEIPFYRARHAVKPGITGWAQVKYRYGASVEDSLIKLEYDLFYIKHQNLLLDLEIALQTLGVVLGFRGR